MIQIFWKLVTKQTSYFLVQVCKGQKKIPQKNFSILLSGTKTSSELSCLKFTTFPGSAGGAAALKSGQGPPGRGIAVWQFLSSP